MVLVCVTDQESCGRLIKAGRNLADMMSVPLKVISVRPKQSGNWFASEELEYLFNLAKQLDAEMIIRFHDYAAEAVADYIEKQNAQAVIVGEPPQAGQSIFITSLEERFNSLPILCVKDDGQLCLAAVYRGNDALDDFR
jgi:K+-sensing histidine kinase KdpD